MLIELYSLSRGMQYAMSLHSLSDTWRQTRSLNSCLWHYDGSIVDCSLSKVILVMKSIAGREVKCISRCSISKRKLFCFEWIRVIWFQPRVALDTWWTWLWVDFHGMSKDIKAIKAAAVRSVELLKWLKMLCSSWVYWAHINVGSLIDKCKDFLVNIMPRNLSYIQRSINQRSSRFKYLFYGG